MIFADNLIMIIPNSLIILFAVVFEIEIISDRAGLFIVCLIAFAFSFIPLVNLLAWPWSKVEFAFKYTLSSTWVFFLIDLIGGNILIGIT